jgi:hypothetical protein
METTAKEVAEWMWAEYKKTESMSRRIIAWQIRSKFGKAPVYASGDGNLTIIKGVLDEFQKLSGAGDVVWSRGSQTWRKRAPHDPPGKRMVR